MANNGNAAVHKIFNMRILTIDAIQKFNPDTVQDRIDTISQEMDE